MKKRLFALFMLILFVTVFLGCNNAKSTDIHVSGFDDGKLYVNIDGKTLTYEKYTADEDLLTKNVLLDTFETQTEIEGIVWEVYSTKEHPDLSYILVISGTNSSWIYKIVEKTQ